MCGITHRIYAGPKLKIYITVTVPGSFRLRHNRTLTHGSVRESVVNGSDSLSESDSNRWLT